MKLIYRVIDFRYMKNYGLIKALRFSRTFIDMFDALAYVNTQSNWYDLRIIAESEDRKKEENIKND